MPSVTSALPVNVPVNLINEFWLCTGPAPGVNEPDGRVNENVVAAPNPKLRTPPSMPSRALKLGLSAVVPHAPGRSPVLGMIKPIFVVFGSGILRSRWRHNLRRLLA